VANRDRNAHRSASTRSSGRPCWAIAVSSWRPGLRDEALRRRWVPCGPTACVCYCGGEGAGAGGALAGRAEIDRSSSSRPQKTTRASTLREDGNRGGRGNGGFQPKRRSLNTAPFLLLAAESEFGPELSRAAARAPPRRGLSPHGSNRRNAVARRCTQLRRGGPQSRARRQLGYSGSPARAPEAGGVDAGI